MKMKRMLAIVAVLALSTAGVNAADAKKHNTSNPLPDSTFQALLDAIVNNRSDEVTRILESIPADERRALVNTSIQFGDIPDALPTDSTSEEPIK